MQDFDLTGTARTLFDQVAQRFGLETVYDGDYPAAGPQIRFRISGIDYREALHDLEAMTSSFVFPFLFAVHGGAGYAAEAQRSGADHARVGVRFPRG